MSLEDEVRALNKLVERLALRFPDVPRSSIELAVHEEHHALDGRPVRAYVPLLVERSTKTRLRTFDRTMSAAQDTITGPHSPSGPPPVAGDPMQPIT